MKSTHVIFLSVFITCVICGFWIGSNLRKDRILEPINLEGASDSSLPTSIVNDQRNILIVTIDRQGQSETRLISVWLVTYFSGNASVSFKPIYPTISNSVAVFNETINNSFDIESVNSDLRLSGEFLDAISQTGAWWNNYIIIDRKIIPNLFSVAKEFSSISSNDTALGNFNNGSTTGDLRTNYEEDSRALQSICEQLANNEFNPSWDMFHDLSPQYINTNMDMQTLVNEWQNSLRSENSSVCVLPLEVLVPLKQ